MAMLSLLPTELLDHIFAFLDMMPPSRSFFDSLPTFHRSSPPEHVLKNISLVSHQMRTSVLNRLFTHLRIDVGSVEKVIQFVGQAGSFLKPESIVVEVLSHSYVSGQPLWWCQLLDQIPVARIIIQCQPEAYHVLFNFKVNLKDSWAFKVPCQYIEFGHRLRLPSETTLCNPTTGLLVAKPWHTLRVNEGSSLAAYTSYEYFLKKHPSLLASLEHHLGVSGQVLQQLAGHNNALVPSSSTLIATAEMFGTLQSFSYVSIFPFYNHVDVILKCVRRMKNLRTLFVKLCPEPGSTILEDAIKDVGGHIDLNDPWSEYVFIYYTMLHSNYSLSSGSMLQLTCVNRVGIAYTLIAYALSTMSSEGPLESFTSGDVGVAGIRDNIVSEISTELIENWAFDGHDTWAKQASSESIETVQDPI